ncbi:universal stress protein [Flavonifractor hominis]|uniref:Universal stress protein n=1 Tax=Flavonifractor hominis TaxID=3133178 RepID=A0ABV1ESC8_9FIRM
MLRLLVPIDGSDRSKQSIDWIKERYTPSEVSVTLLLVREDWDDIRCKEQCALAKEEALPILQESAHTLSDFSVATEVRFGRAGEEILRFAEETEIDIIVMTKSTKSGWIQMIGSVTNHVVKYAKCVVVIVPEMQTK